MNKRDLRLAGAVLACVLSFVPPGGAVGSEPPPRPNILFIILDDYAPDWSQMLMPGRVKTPNLDRLARRGTWFRQAYCPAPACNPSRVSLLTGVEPHRSGVYLNSQPYRRSPTWIGKVTNLPRHFRDHGYLVAGFGKIAHHDFQEDETDSWSEGQFQLLVNEEDIDYGRFARPNTVPPGMPSFYQWGPLPDTWDRGNGSEMQQDTRNTNRAIALVGKPQERPFFCGLGLFRPHLRWYAPQRYFDLYPVDEIQAPPGLRWDDLDDLPPAARAMRRPPIFEGLVGGGYWRQAIQAYLASITYADEQVGRVLDALEQGPNSGNTIVVLISDNGWHNGEKGHYSKYTLWEQATKVACLISVPGRTPGVSDEPVSLVDLYPTLLGLCGLPAPRTHALDGVDLAPLLADPSAGRGRPVLTTQGRGNHAVRSRDYRYIRYRNGEEELYDHRTDPHEWHNLADDPVHAAIKAGLARALPGENAEPIPVAERAAAQ